jgi:desulfoferrodoxin (superoxide reductase-like protein)
MEETGPFDWGIRFEPVVRAVYMDLTQTFVTDVGRLYHGTLENLAASPDGLVTDTEPESAHRLGRLVEYKAPPTRKLMQKIPKEYYMQMQVQMEVADIDACDYCEMKFYSPYKGKMTETYPIVQDGGQVHGTTQGKHYRGWIGLIMSDGMLDRYEYSPFGVQATDWTADLEERLGPTERIYELIPWALEEYYLETVARDRVWWASIMPAVDGFWADVEAARAGTWVAPAANPRKKRKVEGTGEAAGPQIQDMSDDE